jgi:poly-gamma-glutamate synthesis protein (capsule biosynthesis protein)
MQILDHDIRGNRRRKSHWAIVLSIQAVFLLLILFMLGFLIIQKFNLVKNSQPQELSDQINQVSNNHPKTPTDVSLIAVGDIMLSRSVGRTVALQGPDYPFANITSYLKSADFVFANLETPISAGPPVPDGDFSFHSDPSVVKGLVDAGVSMVSIANNHVPNAGTQGVIDTINYLDQADIGHAGAGSNEAAAEAPYYFQKNGIHFALLAYNDKDVVPADYSAGVNHPGTNFMDTAKVTRNVAAAKENADIVIVSMHAGHEYHDIPDVDQVNFAHAAIDAGADIVIGTHPHVVQPVELYKGKYIIYCLGNFVFDQGFSYEVEHGMTVKLDFDKAGLTSIQYNPVVIKNLSQPELLTDQTDIQKTDARLMLEQADSPKWIAEK